jgi:hypothetical protein
MTQQTIAAHTRIIVLCSLFTLMAPLAGCVSFEHAPVSALGCDAALAGQWLPSDTAPTEERIDVSEQCVMSMHARDGRVDARDFKTFEFGNDRYISTEAEDTMVIRDKHGAVREEWPKTRMHLARYRLDGDRLLVWYPKPNEALKAGGDDVTVHTNAYEDVPETDRQRKIETTDVYLAGSREALAAMLRDNGDPLFGDMAEEHAAVYLRVGPEGDRPADEQHSTKEHSR